MPLTLLLNWRVWAALIVAVALAASHWKAYVAGKNMVQVEWDKAKIDAMVQAQLTAKHWQDIIDKERKDAADRELKIRMDAAGARTALLSLSNAADTAMRRAAASHEACLVTAAAATDVLKQCGDKYQGLAEIADRHASDIKTLMNSWPK